MDNQNDWLRALTQGIQYFPKYSELYLARAHLRYHTYMTSDSKVEKENFKLPNNTKILHNALSDFQNFIKYAGINLVYKAT